MGENICKQSNWQGLISKIYKQLMQLTIKKQCNQKMGWGNLNRHFSKEDLQMAKKHMKRCSISLHIRELQIKTTMKHHFTLVRMTITKKSTNSKCWRIYGERLPTPVFLVFPCGLAGKESACNAGDLGSIPGLGRESLSTPVFWPGEFHGLYSPRGLKESDMTEQLSLGFPSSSDSKASVCNAGDPGSISGLGRSPGERNGSPL